MNTRPGLPPEMSGRSFTVHEAQASGIGRSRLNASDLITPTRGIRVPWQAAMTPAEIVAPVLSLMPDAVASFTTAGKIWGFPLPLAHERELAIHVTRPSGTPGSVRPGIVCHRMRLADAETACVAGVRVTSRLRTWLDLASVLSLRELVAVGDYLVCAHPADFPRPRAPFLTADQMLTYLDAQRRVRGLPAARRALTLVRVGSDSVPETELRLAIIEAGLPEPTLNHAIRDAAGRAVAWPDQAFVDVRLSLQYDGEHHRSAEQQASDNWRNRVVADVGWDQLIVSAADVRSRGWDGVASVVAQRLRRLEPLRAVGPTGRQLLA
ncbi:hypothetical protein [Sinomonas mesophila]|uniref:hypothetical protein n=1 Tax=Sinomonas mesophila TaxID=1531955 RepID=UPI0011157CC7|nr:hypothetical protein [Sinomonas mesophila]